MLSKQFKSVARDAALISFAVGALGLGIYYATQGDFRAAAMCCISASAMGILVPTFRMVDIENDRNEKRLLALDKQLQTLRADV